jgi:nitrate/TMAO reductase-like tetraheme cytochrome c subunit
VNYIKAIFVSGLNVFKQLKWPVKILLLIICVSFFATGAIVVTGQPGFCNSCHIMNTYYDSWKNSSHSNVNCLDCHLQPGFTGYVKGKINGLAQAVDCLVGRVGTKPSATVMDSSCLRPECHRSEELVSRNIDYTGIKFTHNNHVGKDVHGIKISCGTCHSHFEGNEHFSVNNDACFICHFLKSSETGKSVVQTSCTDCHEVPDKVIKRGLVTINHAEFVSYKASCEDSCHKREIHKTSKVDDNVCLNCHSFSKEQYADSDLLHEAHTAHEKVECFACHGQVSHGQKEVASISVMMDCQNCHSNTHQVQRTIYTTQHPIQAKDTDRILSPMFLVHVECTGCHIEQVAQKSGALDSYGTVAKAVPRACDKCHEEGTGQQYVPFWQGNIKKMHEQVSLKLEQLKARARNTTNEQTVSKLNQSIEQAQSIIESVSADGSWGVHNFKYTEALLLEADKIISEVR